MLEYPIKLDLGAGQFPKEGFVRLDFDPQGADICWDLKDGIPLPNDSVEELYTSHTLEHFAPTEAHYILREIMRVCRNEAKLEIRLPKEDTPEGQLPCHYSRWNENTLKAVNQWLPHTEKEHFELLELKQEDYTIIGIYKINK